VVLDGKQGETVLPVLKANLKEADGDVRRGAAFVLGEVGPGAKSAEPALKEALNDSKPEVRRAAGQALERIAGKK
jgi:HEAT repeat protein